ncbi:MAG: ferrous iron transporter B, partial [Candidatus Brocadiia bacterium]|nr:ferrous iron transporter B [Candidatus Brocadiia bacterium]
PNILFLFLAIAFLEDSGYMARAAFIMDRIMHKIGLHGKSFIPLLIGFGCNIPAVMATRTLENRRDRLVTILVAPLMSCTARYAVYVLLAGAFFSRSKGAVVFSLYVLGMAMAIVMAKLFRKYLLPGPSTPFVMELPPYRLPTARGLLVHMWERGWLYVKKAGTIILAISVIMWVLSTFPQYSDPDGAYGGRIAAAETRLQTAGKALQEAMTAEGVAGLPAEPADDTTEAAVAAAEAARSAVAGLPEPVRAALSARNRAAAELGECRNDLAQKELAYSSAGRIGRAIVPVIRPLGLDNWKLGTALFAGFGAKEVVVSTLGTLYSLGEVGEESEPLRQALREDMTPLQAYTLMVFVLLYVPCMAAIIVIKRETNSWRWPLFTIAYTTALAWVASFLIYQGGCVLGLG